VGTGCAPLIVNPSGSYACLHPENRPWVNLHSWHPCTHTTPCRHNLTLCSFTYVPIVIRSLTYNALRRMWMPSHFSGHSPFNTQTLLSQISVPPHRVASAYQWTGFKIARSFPIFTRYPGLVRAHRYPLASLPQFRAHLHERSRPLCLSFRRPGGYFESRGMTKRRPVNSKSRVPIPKAG